MLEAVGSMLDAGCWMLIQNTFYRREQEIAEVAQSYA